MSSERRRRVEEIYHGARDRAPGERAAFLDDACAGDADLRRDVESLLSHEVSGAGVLDTSLAAESERNAPEIAATDSERSGDPFLDVLADADTHPGMAWWADYAVVAIATAKVVAGLIAVAWAAAFDPVLLHGAPLNSLPVSTLLVLSFGTTGLLLRLRPDGRALELGGYLLLVASAFSHVLLNYGHDLGPVARVALRLRVDLLLPVYLWMFVRDFPIRAALGRAGIWPWRFVRVSKVVGTGLFVINLLVDLRDSYWPAILLLMVPAAPILLDRARQVWPGDRRRVRFFVYAFGGGLLPIAVDVVLRTISPAWSHFAGNSSTSWGPILVLTALLSVPLTTAYSVVVDRVLDLRLMVRTALQYALARYTVIALIAGPVAWVAWTMYAERSRTIAEVVTRQSGSLLVALGALVIVLPTRRRLFESLDRRFFREHYDADLILARLVESSRQAGSSGELTELLVTQIDRALHPKRLSVFVRSDETGCFEAVEGEFRRLPLGSMLATMLSVSDEALEIDPHLPGPVFSRLEAAAAEWIGEGDFRLLVPLRGVSGVLRGILALGEKKSELGYSKRDQRMLMAVGTTSGLWLDAHSSGTTPGHAAQGDGHPPDSAARECPGCGLVHEPATVSCACGELLREASVPVMLAGKFRLERRVGSGGMGVVYRALDLELDRPVAVKALRGNDAKDTWRLRREARAMALITDPNLALVFGLEFWYGRRFLIVEFLEGGTLADRLARQGPLSEQETSRMGLALAGVLGRLHGSGMLHRDIKPANVGFTAARTVKLLDFGLARHFDVTPSGSAGAATPGSAPSGTMTPRSRLAGTPLYMSPEALAHAKPDVSFDLWSLAVTLFEALAGVNPYRDGSFLDLLLRTQAPDPRRFMSGCGPGVVSFFATALAPDRRVRPATAAAFAELITSCFN
jgi:hypothetical protein